MSSKCKFICFHGIDGSGKTSQATALLEKFQAAGIKSKYVWIGWSPTILKPITKVIKRSVFRKKEVRADDYLNVKQVKKEYFKNTRFKALWYSYVLIDYYSQIFIKIILPKLFGNTIICDRYVHDVLIGLSINFGWRMDELKDKYRDVLVKIFPVPDVTIFIDIPEDVAFKRKDDIPAVEFLYDRRNVYLELFKSLDVNIIDGDRSFNEIHNEIIKIIKEKEPRLNK